MTAGAARAPRTTTVRHGLGEYPVLVGPGLLDLLAPLLARHLAGRTVALVTDTVVGRLYEEWESGAGTAWRAPATAPSAEVPPHQFATRLSVLPGEDAKTRENWMELSDALLSRGFGRDTGLVALGGGVVGDLTGFVAATYMRGVPYVQVPTTLLAMVDASVGGKTGVDTPHGKNLIGAFHPPVAVVADPLTLRSLPERDYRAGLAEVVKHGVVADAGYFEWTAANAAAILARDPDAVTEMVWRSVEIKAAVVSADERESGRRAVLNAGHTVAHALEAASDYALSHGEAVALGLLAEAEMAEAVGVGAPGLRDRIRTLLAAFDLPLRLPFPVPVDRARALMAMDKKNRARGVRMALPADVGRMHPGDGSWTTPVELPVIHRAMAALA